VATSRGAGGSFVWGWVRAGRPCTAVPRVMATGRDRALLAEHERSSGRLFSAGRATLLQTPDRVRRPSPPKSPPWTRRVPRHRTPGRVEDPLSRRTWDTNTFRIRRSRAAG